TRVSLLPRISTSTTEPSGITTGPSGNSRSVARTRISAIKILPALFRLQADFQLTPRTQHFGCGSYGKGDHACQARARRAALRRGAIGGARYNLLATHRT